MGRTDLSDCRRGEIDGVLTRPQDSIVVFLLPLPRWIGTCGETALTI